MKTYAVVSGNDLFLHVTFGILNKCILRYFGFECLNTSFYIILKHLFFQLELIILLAHK